tara:strand:- start:9313 stop:9858 length:546 start_codon:yes stop_codon:yes gene_type:complete
MSLEQNYQAIIEAIGEDANREGLIKTPKRCAEAIKELTSGYSEDINEVLGDAVYESANDEMVIVKDIEFYSLCEHHMMPIVGKCHIGYIPDGKVIGLSKLARIVDHFAKRLQIQENMTKQVADCLLDAMNCKGVAVVIEADHFCMMMRGVKKQNSSTTTSMMLGKFRESDKTRAEFLTLIK